jgi:two-component system KDP operon response regulator KdpE
MQFRKEIKLSENRTAVLIIDDELSIQPSLRTILTGLGFAIVEASCAEDGIALVRSEEFDVVILGMNVPGLGGIELCRLIRRIAPIPSIVMLTTHGREDHGFEAFKAGADDYITRPFEFRDLVVRIRMAVRRSRSAREKESEILIGDVRLDVARHLVQKSGKSVHLTPKQFDLLRHLMANAGRPVPHSKLLRTVWGPDYGNEVEYLRTFVRQVRMKIEDDPANPTYLLTESHIGYRFSECA